MRVAFFGGTFDPIHRGHLAVASAAADAFSLDRVLFAPVGNQPLKSEDPTASFADRMAMTALALTDPATRNLRPATCNFLVSNLDAPRQDGTPNYTVDTLAALACEYPAATLCVLTGADSFLTLRNWRSPAQLLALAEWIVVSRPDFPLTPEFLARPEFSLTPAQRARVHLLTTVHEDVSATELRHRLRAGDSCPGLLPPAVAAYIQVHHLYL
ncbi:MAG TPA: nicotinate (nicotinamide) nucleotide adenylyltransferase [Acidobacteriaceae bacterium]